ncbi:ABC transporter substrate-binding protein [Jiella endophytica]|uniref:sn-glycerol-3-phosphate-binding periplasmic protein UgpB n=1 Tax=Jiella endophytica TaxID=2558362 RepID=A0A4Y8RLA3_9HYPH|nr:ABC transporter substrate-binding protein [Jiella endophytica]TFF23231.1 ABC transporter substrate-binding protein [Jiella endophytica]
MNRRDFLATASAAALLAPLAPRLAHATMAGEITEPVTISFYDYNLASAGLGKEATEKLIAGFMKAHPLIKVDAIAAQSNEILSRVQADLVAGDQPDLAQLVFRDLIYIARDLGAEALEDLAGEELAEHARGMAPKGLDLGKVDGKTYGLAFTFSTPVLFINADLFRAAGLDPENPPRTWDEVRAAGKAIHEKTGKGGFFPGAYGPIDGTFVYQAIAMSNGGMVREGNKLTFADDGAADAVVMLREAMDEGSHARIDPASHMDTFQAGELGMFLFTSAVMSRFEKSTAGKFEMRLAKMPSFGDKPTAPTNSGSALFLLSKDPVKQRAAWELMKYLTSKEAYTIITSEIGYLPLRLDIIDDPKYLKGYVEAHPMLQPNLEQLQNLTPNVAFPGPNYRQVENMMKDAVVEAVFGHGDPRAVLKAAQDQAQPLMPSS